jgi:hypothetical protein
LIVGYEIPKRCAASRGESNILRNYTILCGLAMRI